MKLKRAAAIVGVVLSMNVSAEVYEGDEEHASPEACRQAIAQWAKDSETAAKYNGEFIKVTWRSKDAVKIEYSTYDEELTCKGNISIHRVASKK